MRVMFFLKMFKKESKFKECKKKTKKKTRKYFSFLRYFHLKMLQQPACVRKGILLIGSHRINQQSEDFAYHSEKFFQPELPSQGSINMVKVLSFRFQQCFGPFTMLLVERSFETRLFRKLSNTVFPSP